MLTEAGHRPRASVVRYAQCWEDADVLLQALDVRADDICLSIGSAGDNTLALLTRKPRRVVAVDLNPAQIACLELRVSAYRNLSHRELLELVGSVPGDNRRDLYRRCRAGLSERSLRFWDARQALVAGGIGNGGRFERYLAIFRQHVLPLVHSRVVTEAMLRGGTPAQRKRFYSDVWDTWCWRAAFRIFFSRAVMSRLGRDPACFDYVSGTVSARLLERTRHALTRLNPAENPYLQWICAGRHLTALPLALRPENFEPIRDHLDRLEWHCAPLESWLSGAAPRSVDRLNLSDIFEYLAPAQYWRTLEQLARVGRPGGRIVYWNMLADRHRPPWLATRLEPLTDLAQKLHATDRAFFYSDLVIEAIR